MISIVVGVYNEEEVLPPFIKTFFRDISLKENFELILVNDGSTDNTKKIIIEFKKKYPKIKLISYYPNKGLGNALRTGFKHATGRIIVTMDSDLAHPPRYISKLVRMVDKGYDMVIGSRYIKGGIIKKVPIRRDILSKFTNLITRIAIMSNVNDQTTNFRAYKASKLKNVNFYSNGFEVEIELLVRFMKKNARIKEIPVISYVDREGGEPHFSLLKDSFKYMKGLSKVILYRWI